MCCGFPFYVSFSYSYIEILSRAEVNESFKGLHYFSFSLKFSNYNLCCHLAYFINITVMLNAEGQMGTKKPTIIVLPYGYAVIVVRIHKLNCLKMYVLWLLPYGSFSYSY